MDSPKNILEVLKDKKKLLPDVRSYLEEENKFTEINMKDTKIIQKKLFDEIKGRIKLTDESLPFKDKEYDYWTKVTKEGNYSKKLRKKIGSQRTEIYWDGDKEAEGKKFFSTGDLSVSNNDEYLAYSIDDKGSEYFSIFIRRISDNKIIEEEIKDTSGNITWSYDDKFIFYSKLDKYHRPRQIFKHQLGTSTKKDVLIFDEKDEKFTCSIGTSSDEKFYFILTSEHTSSEVYFFDSADNVNPKIFFKRKEGVEYSVDSWNGYFWIHTNDEAKDFKICRCKHDDLKNIINFVPPKNNVMIGGFSFLNDWIIRSERNNALEKLFVRNLKTNIEEELKIINETVINPGVSLMQKDRNTNKIRVGFESPKTPGRTYEYDIISKEKNWLKKLRYLLDTIGMSI